MHDQLDCSVCNRTGKPTGDFVIVGSLRVDLVTGLDPKNCYGCWDTMERNGIAQGTHTTDDSGNPLWEAFPRPAAE